MAITISTYVCSSCAVGSIAEIGTCQNPIDVLSQVCQCELGSLDPYMDRYSKLTCFYVFCAGPEVISTSKGGSHHSKDHWPKYGTEFAQFLLDNKLGEVVSLGPKYNARHHRSSTAQVWIWSPDQEAVEAWWTNHQKGKR